MVDELFTAAELMNPAAEPDERYGEPNAIFHSFLSEDFPETPQVWSRSHNWRAEMRRRSAKRSRYGLDKELELSKGPWICPMSLSWFQYSSPAKSKMCQTD